MLEGEDGLRIEGEQMVRLSVRTLASLEDSIVALERRGISLRAHANRRDAETGRLPVYHVFHGPDEYWFASRAKLDEFVARQEAETGEEMAVDDAENGQKDDASDVDGNGQASRKLRIVELGEVRSINNRLKVLAELGFDIQSLIPQQRTGLQESRFRLCRGDTVAPLEELRGLSGAVRSAGEKGLTITRFKGLGEMNPEELRETTLNPQNRTLCRVTMNDASAADDMFRILMGDKVEPRREFIEKHALEVRNLDV